MRKQLISKMLIIILLLITQITFAQQRVVKVSINDSWPDSFLDKQGKPQGLYIDLLNEIAKKENWQLIYVMEEWKVGLKQLENSEVDLKISLAKTIARDSIFDFSQEPAYTDWANVVCNESAIQNILDLQNLKVAITEQGFFPQEFQNLCAKFEITPQFVKFKTDDEILLAVANKQVDAGVVPHIFAILNTSKHDVTISPIVFSPIGVYFAVSEGKNSDILSAIDQQLKTWKSDRNSFYYEALNKWIYSVNSRATIPSWLINALFITGLILFAALFFIILLKIQVKRATSTIRQNENALRESEEKFRSYTENAPDGIFIVNSSGFYIDANPAAYKMFACSKKELLTMHISQFLCSEDQEKGKSSFHALSTIGNYENEFNFIRMDGTNFYGLLSAKKIDENRYLGFVKDITERKIADNNLAAQRQIYEQILEHSLAGYWDWDIPTGDEYLSPTLKKMFGYEVNEIENRAESWQKLIFSEDLPRVNNKFNQHIESKGEIPFYNEVRYHHKNGSVVWVICTGKVIEWDGEGKAKRMIGCHVDITDRKQAEAAIIQAKEKAEAASLTRSIFLANMSHEIRTPINVILGFSSLLKKQSNLDSESRIKIERINLNGEYLLNMFNDILSMSKIDAGRIKLNATSFNLLKLVKDVMDMMQPWADEKNLKLVGDNAANLAVIVETDALKLKQILINLLNNAIKFTETGSITLRADFLHQVAKGKATLFIEVKDTGIGISTADQQRIFEPFIQVDNLNYQKGTGLGLSICKKYLELLCGIITVESEIGQGSCFRIELPVKVKRENIPSEAIYHLPEIDNQPQLSGEKPFADTDYLKIKDLQSSDILSNLTEETKKSLHAALVRLDTQLILEIIAEITKNDERAGKYLSTLADQFKFTTIIQALKLSITSNT